MNSKSIVGLGKIRSVMASSRFFPPKSTAGNKSGKSNKIARRTVDASGCDLFQFGEGTLYRCFVPQNADTFPHYSLDALFYRYGYR